MISRYVIVSVQAALVLCSSRVCAQRPPVCDSTILVSHKLMQKMNVRRDIEDWVPANSAQRVLAEQPEPRNMSQIGHILVSALRSQLRDQGNAASLAFALLVDTTGTVLDVRILQSSRYPDLDLSAESALRTSRYAPLRLDAGCAVAAILHMPIDFRRR